VRGQFLPAEEPFGVPALEGPHPRVGRHRRLDVPGARRPGQVPVAVLLGRHHALQQPGDVIEGVLGGAHLAALIGSLAGDQLAQLSQPGLDDAQHPPELSHLLAQFGEPRCKGQAGISGHRRLDGVQPAKDARHLGPEPGTRLAGRVQRLPDHRGQVVADRGLGHRATRGHPAACPFGRLGQ